MPYDEVMHKWKHGDLHSGSKHGKKVTNRKQAIAIMLSEKRSNKKEYHSLDIGPSPNFMQAMGAGLNNAAQNYADPMGQQIARQTAPLMNRKKKKTPESGV